MTLDGRMDDSKDKDGTGVWYTLLKSTKSCFNKGAVVGYMVAK